jgi:hypothetical protein
VVVTPVAISDIERIEHGATIMPSVLKEPDLDAVLDAGAAGDWWRRMNGT